MTVQDITIFSLDRGISHTIPSPTPQVIGFIRFWPTSSLPVLSTRCVRTGRFCASAQMAPTSRVLYQQASHDQGSHSTVSVVPFNVLRAVVTYAADRGNALDINFNGSRSAATVRGEIILLPSSDYAGSETGLIVLDAPAAVSNAANKCCHRAPFRIESLAVRFVVNLPFCWRVQNPHGSAHRFRGKAHGFHSKKRKCCGAWDNPFGIMLCLLSRRARMPQRRPYARTIREVPRLKWH